MAIGRGVAHLAQPELKVQPTGRCSMKALNPLARLFAALAACVVVAMIAVATASAKQTVSALPPNGVYTCGWIATHPAAAARARVTCDASVFFSAMRQSPPIAGSVVTALASPDTIDSTGCWDIPEDGSRISPGVYAWSSWEYANRWSWAAHYGPPVDYTWYIQKSGPITVLYDRWTDLGHSDTTHRITMATYNVYRLGFQNHSYPTQSWYHCHVVV
jgi:hypothetical protein